MFKRYLEHKEYKQLRKEHKEKQLMRYRFIFLAVMGALLLAFAGIEMATPPESAKSENAVSVSNPKEEQEDIQQEQQVTSEIERFAYVVTKPLETLTPEDLDFVEEKAEDPCYEKHASLPQEQMVDAITVCKLPK